MSLPDRGGIWNVIADLEEPKYEIIVAHAWLNFDVALVQQEFH
jgi:hypothetical protein